MVVESTRVEFDAVISKTSSHHYFVASHMNEKDAYLIANAPEWLQYLLQENQRYQEALETMAESEDDWYVGRTTMKEFASQALKKEGE